MRTSAFFSWSTLLVLKIFIRQLQLPQIFSKLYIIQVHLVLLYTLCTSLLTAICDSPNWHGLIHILRLSNIQSFLLTEFGRFGWQISVNHFSRRVVSWIVSAHSSRLTAKWPAPGHNGCSCQCTLSTLFNTSQRTATSIIIGMVSGARAHIHFDFLKFTRA